jgi:1-acyl-sn-glycerol-3-phosphate acyltransferase
LKNRLPHTTLLTRVARLTRVVLHFLVGFFMLATSFARRPAEQRAEITLAWSKKFLAILGFEIRLSGAPPERMPRNTLVVCNHISWIDILVLASCSSTRFIAKKEILHWPVVGKLIQRGGTLFIDRSNRRDASRVNKHMAEALQNGDSLTVFPEGTTSLGHGLLPFKASLFESAILAGSVVQPVAIRYRDETGHVTTAPSYAGETTFWECLRRVLRLRKIVIDIHFGAALHTGQGRFTTRAELAEAARLEVEHGFTLLSDRPGKAMKTPACPPVEVP